MANLHLDKEATEALGKAKGLLYVRDPLDKVTNLSTVKRALTYYIEGLEGLENHNIGGKNGNQNKQDRSETSGNRVNQKG